MCEVATGSAMAAGSPSVLVSVGIAPRFSSMQRGRIRLSGYNTTAARFPQVELAARQWQPWAGCAKGDQSPEPIACLEADGHAQLPGNSSGDDVAVPAKQPNPPRLGVDQTRNIPTWCPRCEVRCSPRRTP